MEKGHWSCLFTAQYQLEHTTRIYHPASVAHDDNKWNEQNNYVKLQRALILPLLMAQNQSTINTTRTDQSSCVSGPERKRNTANTKTIKTAEGSDEPGTGRDPPDATPVHHRSD